MLKSRVDCYKQKINGAVVAATASFFLSACLQHKSLTDRKPPITSVCHHSRDRELVPNPGSAGGLGIRSCHTTPRRELCHSQSHTIGRIGHTEESSRRSGREMQSAVIQALVNFRCCGPQHHFCVSRYLSAVSEKRSLLRAAASAASIRSIAIAQSKRMRSKSACGCL